jgi:hypothetical protein
VAFGTALVPVAFVGDLVAALVPAALAGALAVALASEDFAAVLFTDAFFFAAEVEVAARAPEGFAAPDRLPVRGRGVAGAGAGTVRAVVDRLVGFDGLAMVPSP